MKTIRSIIACALAVLLLAASPVPSAYAQGGENCWAVGQAIAAQRGGELVNASPAGGGQKACVVVILVRNPGQPPRRVQMVVPLL